MTTYERTPERCQTRQSAPLGLVSTAIGAAIAIAVMDNVMIAVALPIMARDFNASNSSTILVVSAYQLAIAMLILPLSALAARLGLKHVYLASIALLGIGSLACAFSPNLHTLIIARIVQGAGGAGITALTNGLLRHIYPPSRLSRAFGINVAVAAVAISAGPSMAAFLLGVLSWHWLFLINLPVAVFGIAAGMRWFGRDQHEKRRSSLLGVPLSMFATGSTVVVLNLLGQGVPGIWVAAGAIASAAGWLLFMAQQRRSTHPILPVALLKISQMWMSVLVFFLTAFAQTTAYLAIPFLLHDAGYRLAQIGLVFTAWPIAIMVIAPVSTRLCRKFNLGLLSGTGLLVMAAGLAGLALIAKAPSQWLTVELIALSGLGYGFYQTPNNQTLATVAPMAQASDATALGALGRVFGQASGAAVFALVLRLQGEQATSLVLGLAAALALIAAAACIKRGSKPG